MYIHPNTHSKARKTLTHIMMFFDGYCSTVQGLLDSFKVDLGFTELSFIQKKPQDPHPHMRGGGLGSSTIFKKFNEPYAPS